MENEIQLAFYCVVFSLIITVLWELWETVPDSLKEGGGCGWRDLWKYLLQFYSITCWVFFFLKLARVL